MVQKIGQQVHNMQYQSHSLKVRVSMQVLLLLPSELLHLYLRATTHRRVSRYQMQSMRWDLEAQSGCQLQLFAFSVDDEVNKDRCNYPPTGADTIGDCAYHQQYSQIRSLTPVALSLRFDSKPTAVSVGDLCARLAVHKSGEDHWARFDQAGNTDFCL